MANDFSPIQADYTFFEDHSTEADEDVRAYLPHLAPLKETHPTIRLLDFGCGEGRFSARFLNALNVPPDRLELLLVEPAENCRGRAVELLQGSTTSSILNWPAMPAHLQGCCDLALANHSLYYVSHLREAVSEILRALTPSGLFLCALAGRENTLVQFWDACFGWIGRRVPYYTAEDLEGYLKEQGLAYLEDEVSYELRFPDSEANRIRILRFLLNRHFIEVPRQPMLALFDPYLFAGTITMRIAHRHFTVFRR